MMYKLIVELLSKKPRARFTQEQVAHAVDTTPKRAQATLSKLFANEVIEREHKGDGFHTDGRFVYFVKSPVDSSLVKMDNGPRLTKVRVRGKKYGQRDLPLV